MSILWIWAPFFFLPRVLNWPSCTNNYNHCWAIILFHFLTMKWFKAWGLWKYFLAHFYWPEEWMEHKKALPWPLITAQCLKPPFNKILWLVLFQAKSQVGYYLAVYQALHYFHISRCRAFNLCTALAVVLSCNIRIIWLSDTACTKRQSPCAIRMLHLQLNLFKCSWKAKQREQSD